MVCDSQAQIISCLPELLIKIHQCLCNAHIIEMLIGMSSSLFTKLSDPGRVGHQFFDCVQPVLGPVCQHNILPVNAIQAFSPKRCADNRFTECQALNYFYANTAGT